jgi:hypothetical protein
MIETMLEYVHLWRTILGIIGRLLTTSTTNVPEDDATVITTAGKNAWVMRMPLNLSDNILVTFHTVYLAVAGKSHVKDTNSTICGTSRKEHIVLLVKGQRVDSIRVTFDSDGWF